MAYTATDREQIEEIKKWWSSYGKAIAIAVIIGLIIGFGWRYWQRYQTAEEMSASAMYQTTLMAASRQKTDAALDYVNKLQNDFGKSVYATLASLLAAKVAVIAQKYPKAHSELEWVIKNGKSAAFKQVARLRDARVLLQMKQPAKAHQVLATVEDNDFQPQIDVIQGDIYQAQGKTKQAQQSYVKADAAYKAAGMNNPFLKLRLNK